MESYGDEPICNTSANETLEDVIAAGATRRSVLRGGLMAAIGAAFAGGAGAALNAPHAAAASSPTDRNPPTPPDMGGGYRPTTSLIGFESVPVNTDDTITLPPGYSSQVLIAWGDPVSDGPAFAQDASNTAAEQAQQWGMHNDGLVFFPIGRGGNHGLIVQNHEYVDQGLLFPDGVANWNADKTSKALAAHGVGIIEVRRRNGTWKVVRPSKYARRITGETSMTVTGPAAGDTRMMTSVDPTGLNILGTLNNCAMGRTPWNTYLACEENFNGYFKRSSGTATTDEARYGIGAGFGYMWETTHPRFQVETEPNEANRFGWVVEIDPFNPSSTPIKRTALGRFKHEGAWCQEARDGKVVVYMGDDERFEYLYRYVSSAPWRDLVAQGISPLDSGTLYVGKFSADGTGEWLPLTPENPALAGWTAADIAIRTRVAADAAGATKLDRPEWADTIPWALMGLVTLTNNSRRGTGTNPAVDATSPRATNNYGHILRWFYDSDFTQPTFWWDIFALGGDPAVPAHGSTIRGDKYGSPDGLYIAPSGRMWIQTDVSTSTIDAGAYAGFGNNQMLCADPTSTLTKRFLVGPKQCEVTGAWVTPNERTMFVGIQHPGERPDDLPGDPANPKQFSSWPDGAAGGRPRSSLIVITKDDGGPIGS